MSDFIRCEKYITYSNGATHTLMCKVCGTVIGTKQLQYLRDIDGGRNKIYKETFQRLANYHEIKISFTDGSAHVTNGCKTCLTRRMTPAELKQLEMCDMRNMGINLPNIDRTPRAVVEHLADDRGIV